ncbi:MAG: helix-turn-helix domain-containing protein [Candidatus Bipolaricaulia bacterium]
MTTATTYVHGAERMVTAARLTSSGLYVRFADEREGVIPFRDLKLSGEADHVMLPRPHVIEIHLADGSVEEVPWDFARHYADDGYRARSEALAQRGRQVFGDRLKALRVESGLTQASLAGRAGINRVTIARIESGEQLPRYQTLSALAEALGLPIERLLVGEDAD